MYNSMPISLKIRLNGQILRKIQLTKSSISIDSKYS